MSKIRRSVFHSVDKQNDREITATERGMGGEMKFLRTLRLPVVFCHWDVGGRVTSPIGNCWAMFITCAWYLWRADQPRSG